MERPRHHSDAQEPEHLRRVVATLLRVGGAALADQRSLQRENSITLRAAIQRSLSGGRSSETRAHLREAAATIDAALRANLLRTGT